MKAAEGLKRNLQAMIQKAHRALNAARNHYKTADYDFASSKAVSDWRHGSEALIDKNNTERRR